MIETGFYFSLLSSGKLKEEDQEVDIQPFMSFVDAFRELSSCRTNGMGLGPIPFTAIVEYSKIFEVDDFEDFHYCIRAMDNAVLKMESDKTSKKISKNEPPPKKKG